MITKNFARVIQNEMNSDPELQRAIEQQVFNAKLAEQIVKAREEAGLTQFQLAKKIGTHQSVISRIENSDYNGRSLTMLNKIADALECTISIEFVRRWNPSDEQFVTTIATSTSMLVASYFCSPNVDLTAVEGFHRSTVS